MQKHRRARALKRFKNVVTDSYMPEVFTLFFLLKKFAIYFASHCTKSLTCILLISVPGHHKETVCSLLFHDVDGGRKGRACKKHVHRGACFNFKQGVEFILHVADEMLQ